ncbi:MAG: FIST C-terminal domain-containing protein [Bacteroidia bacterium]|nr:FIST C-terminal domain-containing protein [Bacteroidia bacterium]
MKVEQLKWTKETGWRFLSEIPEKEKVQLVLAFGHRDIIQNSEHYQVLRLIYPNANIIFCSTSGEIIDTKVSDESIVVSALYFENTPIQVVRTTLKGSDESYEAGKKIAESLFKEDIIHMLVFSDGQIVNGSELVRGINENLRIQIPVCGGLAGDNARFERTAVGLNETPREGQIIAVGFYGTSLKVGHGSMGGWSVFGPERTITKSKANILYELDNQSALQLYKIYLGEQANGLPGTALLFPLSIRSSVSGESVVRTILSINEEDQSMIFAGDIPEGAKAQLMFANFNKLIDGAILAANYSLMTNAYTEPDYALLISCVGRKLLLKHRVEEEVEEVRGVLGKTVPMSGFYSNGEISPLVESPVCELYNQTMTITTYTEVL